MRTIEDFKVNPANDKLKISVLDQPGAGGASHEYEISGFNGPGIPPGSGYVKISFQNGAINEHGVNGITQEVLLAIVADRLHSFQSGPFACEENGKALMNVLEAQEALLSQTRARMARGVEGKTVA